MGYGMVCITHGKTAVHEPSGPVPCAWFPVEGIVGIGIVYQMECSLHSDLQASQYGTLVEALADRDAHIKSHTDGHYG